MYNRVLFVLQGERYSENTQGSLCVLVNINARHYRDVRLKYEEKLNDDIRSRVENITDRKIDDHQENEMAGLKRVIRELSLVGLSGVIEWSNNEGIDAQKPAIESAKAISNSKLWADCSIFRWFVSMSPDERVKSGCKL